VKSEKFAEFIFADHQFLLTFVEFIFANLGETVTV